MDSQKPHILILPKWYPNSIDPQLGIFIQNHANLISKEFNVSVIYVSSDPHIKSAFNIEKTQNELVSEIRITYRQVTYFKKIRQFIRFRKAQKAGLALIENTIDLVHVHVPIRPALLAIWLKKKRDIPFLITEHWSGHLNGQFNQRSKPYRFLYKRILSKAVQVSAVSNPLAQKINQLTKTTITVIPNFILDPSITFKAVKSTYIELVSVSDLNDGTKNILGLLNGFKMALDTNKQLRLSIIGDGPDKDKIIQRAKELDLLNYVSFLGRKTQQEVQKLLHEYDFYVCNSNVETFGMTVAEALMAGKPVVCTRCGGPESFVNETNGLLIAPRNDENLSQAILKMTDNFQQYNASIISKETRDKFGADSILTLWKTVYRSILNG